MKLIDLDADKGYLLDGKYKVEPIVHCKDCKYAHRLPEALTCRRLTNWYRVEDDNYCSFGEKKGARA